MFVDFDEDALVTVSDKKGNKIGTVTNPKTRVKSLEELQNRLLELKKNKRLNYKEKLLKKGLKNRIKKRVNKLNKKPGKGQQKSENGGSSDIQVKSEDEKDTKMNKPIFNSQGKMVFSKFDFGKAETKNKVKTKLNDPQKILKDIEAKSAKLKELANSGEKDKAEELKKKTLWNTALSKADGQKVKDDPELLKKTIKRREQQVNKSKKKWQTRQEGVQKAKEERQKKRSENINKRKKDKKMTKLKKASKKGKIIPGL